MNNHTTKTAPCEQDAVFVWIYYLGHRFPDDRMKE